MFNYSKLADAIKASGKTKAYLCRKIGRPEYYLRDVIKQKNAIPEEVQEILANEIGVTVDFLNDREPEGEDAQQKKPVPNWDELSDSHKKLIEAVYSMDEASVTRLQLIVDMVLAEREK